MHCFYVHFVLFFNSEIHYIEGLANMDIVNMYFLGQMSHLRNLLLFVYGTRVTV